MVECFTDERVSPAVAPGYVLGTPKQHVQRELGLADVADFQDLFQRSSLEGHHHQHIGIRFQTGCSSCHRAEQNHLLRGERLHQAIGKGLESLLRDERGHSHGSIIAGPARVITFGQAHRNFRFNLRCRMLMAQLWGSGRQHLPLAEALVRLWATAGLRAELVAPLDWERADPPPIPLQLHGRYSRAEVFAAFGLLNETRPFPGREGVFYCCAEAFGFDDATQCDVFFITLKKSERLFSPTTRYNDYAISPQEFQWESQSLTREASATGQRYIHHAERGSRVLLFVREENKWGEVTLPFLCPGFAEYVSHEGERPMAIRWRLQRAIPGAFVPELALAV